jgi:phosphatidylserine decarboxylase
MRMAPEGWPFIIPGWTIVAVLAWLSATQGGWWWAPTVVLGLFAVWLLVFFRDPIRTGPRGDGAIISPADGTIVGVTEVPEPSYLKAPALRVSIFMSVVNVHVNRYPVSGTVEYTHYNPGKFLHAAKEKASLDNEQSSVGLRGARGPLLVRQIAGSIARRIVTDAKPGDRVAQAERLGMIRFGSRVDVFIPAAARPKIAVKSGEHVFAGATVLAEYP